jgi:hypothetical protein
MHKSKIEQLIDLLRSALLESGAHASELNLEQIAIVVYDSMSNPERNFHNVHHVFDVAQKLDGVSVLAAIFHDIIYYQVDRSFRSSVENLVYENIEIKNELFFVKAPKNDLYEKLHIIFGVKAGDSLDVFNGLNEFLSAAVSLAMLESLLNQNQLLKIMGLIESTIPFRKDPISVLVTRFQKINFPTEEMSDLINRSIDFSNRDVFNFAEADSKKFLNNTWNLISETNYCLRRDVDNYSVLEYRLAIYKSYLFFKNLDPLTIFTKYNNYPSEDNWALLNKAAKINIEVARKYLTVQLVSIAAIEAIAELTGGNTPMTLLMGEVRRRDQKITRMEDYLGVVANPIQIKDDLLMRLLEDGRSQESSFDMKNSPLGAFICKTTSAEQIEIIFQLVITYFDHTTSARMLIENYPKDVMKKIIIACSMISSTRKNILVKLSESII